ncbi:interferon-induced GTP-binding protein Mx-like [Acipenser oxyrinchus oxyrinchus]|uniref:Interferon-induced GTP-binding protein Mx-like n=1 Tax=Acipenser oxyrinchus oxyrinchus TaxID=40147 RepID=A0AAD8CDX5_ACIOX|nr:interferon-induced GTP-binding protein Mx-like [Acipenser oxyrinchus oxyrinchus]
MDNVFHDLYEDKVRPYLDFIDSLRALGVDQDLPLPTIVVIGDQSSGKSSVLEALSGVSLPRGGGLMTRCPLELILKNVKTGEWKGMIAYKDYEKKLRDPSEVEREIKTAQDTVAGKNNEISTERITLKIESRTAPDLTLIDLPGIARIAVGSQSHDIEKTIKKLINSYIKKAETINLVVIPCNTDIATAEALKMAKEVDPSGERTLAVLTKPDLIDKGAEEQVNKLLRNELVFLQKGYLIVRCRGQQDIDDKMSLPEALKQEKEFFESNKHFRRPLAEKQASVPCLADRLTSELVYKIKKSLSTIESQLQSKVEETNQELALMGEAPSDDSRKESFLSNKIREFCNDIIALASGDFSQDFVSDLKLFPASRECFEEWQCYLDQQESDLETEDDFRNKVEGYIERCRGRQLPGFLHYRVFESSAKRLISKLEEPALDMQKKMSDKVKSVLTKLAYKHFAGLPNLLKETKVIIDKIRQMQDDEANQMIKTLFRMESMIYTQDSTYSYRLELMEHTVEGSMHNNNKGLMSRKSEVSLLTTHLKTYYKIASSRLADLVPMAIKYYQIQESTTKLQKEMFSILQKRDLVDELVEEEGTAAEKRRNLIERRERLNKARLALIKF